ncbi:MAG: hypothetical protein ACI9EW_000918 [Cellvibrionaceae bacterium]|jgi:hypothetical protein
MSWLAISKSWKVFLFLFSPVLLQLYFELADNLVKNPREGSSLAFSLLSMGLSLFWIREIGVALAPFTPHRLWFAYPVFSAACWATAASFLTLGFTSILAANPEIFLEPSFSFLRPLFFVALNIFMACVVFAARQIQKAENPNQISTLDTLNISFSIAVSLLGVWFIQPRLKEIFSPTEPETPI